MLSFSPPCAGFGFNSVDVFFGGGVVVSLLWRGNKYDQERQWHPGVD